MLKIMKYDFLNGWNAVKKLMLIGLVLAVLDGLTMVAAGGQVTIGSGVFAIMGDEGMTWWIIALNVCWFSVMMALFCITVERIIHNLYGKMFGKEGALTHTLPVERWELLLGKALGTWLFGQMMLIYAAVCVLAMFVVAAAGTITFQDFAVMIQEALPQLEPYHMTQMAQGLGYLLLGMGLQLLTSFMMVVCLQFVCIVARQFGRYALAAGIILAVLMLRLSGMGFLVVALMAVLSWPVSLLLLEKRLSLT